jgi:carboxyl-terminal processing protease
VARYYTPKHRSIQELGITPDVLVPETAPAARDDEGPGEKDLERHFRNEVATTATSLPRPGGPAQDHQLRTALDYLRAASIWKAAPVPPPAQGKR